VIALTCGLRFRARRVSGSFHRGLRRRPRSRRRSSAVGAASDNTIHWHLATSTRERRLYRALKALKPAKYSKRYCRPSALVGQNELLLVDVQAHFTYDANDKIGGELVPGGQLLLLVKAP
jgi:hypothetical protein